jgi:flagellar L-ring protein precursor FlgH
MTRHSASHDRFEPSLLPATLLVLMAALTLGAPALRVPLIGASAITAQAAPPPTPPTTPPADSISVAAALPVRAPRTSWVADRRAYAVGDVITVLIDDYTISTAVKDNIATDTRRRNLGAVIRLPLQGSRSGGIDARNDSDTQQRGLLRRENRFQNEMSVRVVATGDNGLLQVRGTKNIMVDKAHQDVVFEGWVRAQDVSPQNLVESYRVADATLAYTSPGPLGKTKSGLFTRILGLFLP